MKMDRQSLGYGTSVWSKSTHSAGRMDGIGVYTQSLFAALKQECDLLGKDLLPFSFFSDQKPLSCGPVQRFSEDFYPHIFRSTVLKHRMSVSLDLFHATDHYIPRLDVPVIATVMDLIPFLHPEWTSKRLRTLKNWAFKKTILSADHLITISEYSKKDLIRYFSIPETHISVTPLGVDVDYFSKISLEEKQKVLSRYQLSSGFFLFVGTLQPRKNLEMVLAAHALCSESLRKRYPVVIVGKNGWGTEQLLSKIHQLEGQGYVRWLNYVSRSDLFALLQSASALMFLSKYEGFGLPVLEGFASGCPVIASNQTSIPEVAGDAAVLVSGDDEWQVKESMLQLLEDPVLSDRCRERGTLRAQQFSWEACAKATLKAYDQCLT